MRTPRAWSSLRLLEEPSPTSSHPLTSHVVLGHHRIGSKPTDSCRVARDSSAYEVGLTRRPGSPHRPPPRESKSSLLPRENGGTTRDAFRRAVSPVSFRMSTMRFSNGDLMPCDTRQDRRSCPARLTARSAFRTPVRSSACLYMRLCGASSSRAFPTRTHTPPEAELLFRARYLPRQRRGSSLRASSPFLRFVLRRSAETEHDAYDRLLLPTA